MGGLTAELVAESAVLPSPYDEDRTGGGDATLAFAASSAGQSGLLRPICGPSGGVLRIAFTVKVAKELEKVETGRGSEVQFLLLLLPPPPPFCGAAMLPHDSPGVLLPLTPGPFSMFGATEAEATTEGGRKGCGRRLGDFGVESN